MRERDNKGLDRFIEISKAFTHFYISYYMRSSHINNNNNYKTSCHYLQSFKHLAKCYKVFLRRKITTDKKNMTHNNTNKRQTDISTMYKLEH